MSSAVPNDIDADEIGRVHPNWFPPARRNDPAKRMVEGSPTVPDRGRARPSRELEGVLRACMARPDRVMFLDVETTGLSHFYDETTVVGWAMGGRSSTLVRGQEPSRFLEDARDAIALVTFNGIRFDQRFLRAEFPDMTLPARHVDLMYLCRRVGLTGGQKAIEKKLGIGMRVGVDDVDGLAAVILWHRHLRGDPDALRRLVLYNRADIAAMGAILDTVLDKLLPERDLFLGRVRFAEWAGPSGWRDVPSFGAAIATGRKHRDFESLLGTGPASSLRVVGIDLTGSEARGSGWCLLEGRNAQVQTIHADDDLVERTLDCSPDVVSIDSPLCLPAGRVVVDDSDPGRDRFGIMRECERELKRRGVNVYPCLLPSMQKLTARGMRLATIFRARGVPVIESYPGAAQDIMRIPRKGAGVEWLRLGLQEFGIRGELEGATHDELDAVTSALVGSFHWDGSSEAMGTVEEAPLIIPRLEGGIRRVVVGVSGPIAAGKTTLARALERLGFAYTRFSAVLDDDLTARGLPLDRANRQALGAEINRSGHQRRLAERTLLRVGDAPLIVVDGLRFPDDHAFLAEMAGGSYVHVFIDAAEPVRRERYEQRSPFDDFGTAENSEVEGMVGTLRILAHRIFTNDGIINDLEDLARELVTSLGGGRTCPSP